jgi:two-component system, chemotaxis family, response regulator Rcp1
MANHSEGADGRLKQLRILLIENDPAAARLTKEAFKLNGLADSVTAVSDGEDALALLRREQQFAEHPRPDIIFLDLHLPRKSGLEVLKELKANPDLALTPVIVVSGSDDPQEVRRAYELHASCYVRKPDDLDELLQFVCTCYGFWADHVVLPPQ